MIDRIYEASEEEIPVVSGGKVQNACAWRHNPRFDPLHDGMILSSLIYHSDAFSETNDIL